MTWEQILVVSTIVIGSAGFTLSAVKWLLSSWMRSLDTRFTALETALHGIGEEHHRVEKDLLRLQAELPREYIMREDWIRVSASLDSKIDAIHAEIAALTKEVHERP